MWFVWWPGDKDEIPERPEGHNVFVKIGDGHMYLLVPLSSANEDRVRRFTEGLKARCSGVGPAAGVASPETASKRSFADELRLLSELKAKNLLSDEEAAEAIRKLMAQ